MSKFYAASIPVQCLWIISITFTIANIAWQLKEIAVAALRTRMPSPPPETLLYSIRQGHDGEFFVFGHSTGIGQLLPLEHITLPLRKMEG